MSSNENMELENDFPEIEEVKEWFKNFRDRFSADQSLNDEDNLLALKWAIRCKKLDPWKEVQAAKAIDNILAMGRLNKLGEKNTVVAHDLQKHP